MPLLVVEKGHDKGKAIPIADSKTVLIGRDNSTTFPLKDTMASRMHCKIQAEEDGYYLTDLESMNGTYLNGEKVRETIKLSYGDLIKIGDTLFTFLSDDTAATTLAGQRVGGYKIIERVGRGGMGTVYKAEQVDLQRVVALKVISEEHTKDKDFVDLFIHEARAAAKLNHPNIVQVYDVKRHNDYYYFSMEFVSGGSVQEILNKQRRVPWEQSVQMILDAARGLDYAHKKGIVHRDVKPDNLMIAETGIIKIGDMGLARGLEEKVGPEEETSVIGTPHYIAPEQVLGRPADFRSDIYSLGATAYRMIAGVTPFAAPSVRDLVNKKVREDAASIQEHSPEVPRALCEIVARMMVRDPDRRYQAMSEVITGLEKFQRGQADATAESRREPTTTVGMLVSSKKFLVAAAAALFILVGAVVLYAIYSGGNGTLPIHQPVIKEVDPAQAVQALELVKLTELKKMDRKDPRSVEKVIADYASVMERYPATPAAAEAGELKASLEKILKEVRADRKLQLAESEEIAHYNAATQPFLPRQPNLKAIDSAMAAYQSIAKADDAKGTPAADEAGKRAEHVRTWKNRLMEKKVEFERVVSESAASLSQKRHRDAWTRLSDFQAATRKAELECPFARDRYRSMLYDQAVEPEIQRVIADARDAWTQSEKEAAKLREEKNYDSAIRILDAVITGSIDEVVQKARPLRDALESELVAMTRRDLEEAERLRNEARSKALAGFSQASQGARDLVLKYDFKGALQKMKVMRDANASEEYKPRLDRRVAELERASQFKDSLLLAVKGKDAKGNPSKFKTDYTGLQGLEGSIEDADERGLTVRLGVGGAINHAWAQFDPREFYAFVRAQWKYSKEQKREPIDQCNLAALLMEFGLYEEAQAEIQVVLDLMEDPFFTTPPGVAAFCAEYKVRLEKSETAEFEEIEAQKRLGRLDLFMKSIDTYKAARTEIDLLRARYAKTNAVLKAQPKIDEYLQRINKEGGENFNRNLKEERHRLLMARVAEEQSAAKKAQTDIVSRLNKLEDLFERSVHLGAVYAAAGDWRTSSDRYSDARRIGEAMIQRKEVGREFLPFLGHVYSELYRNAVLLKDRKGAEAIRNEGSKRFINPDTKSEEEWWSNLSGWLGSWSESVFPVEEKKLARLREDVRGSPDDPNRLWALAQTCSEGVFNLPEARGYYLWLLENHPEFSQVQNGNCLYRLAEIHFAAREIREGIKRYLELSSQHKEHSKVGDVTGTSGVKRRLDECYKLLTKMGYSRDKKSP